MLGMVITKILQTRAPAYDKSHSEFHTWWNYLSLPVWAAADVPSPQGLSGVLLLCSVDGAIGGYWHSRGLLGSSGAELRKKCPPAQLCASDLDKYEASLWMLSIIPLAE
eukprot:6817350-Ditylum_brightwellii.AAC.1